MMGSTSLALELKLELLQNRVQNALFTRPCPDAKHRSKTWYLHTRYQWLFWRAYVADELEAGQRWETRKGRLFSSCFLCWLYAHWAQTLLGLLTSIWHTGRAEEIFAEWICSLRAHTWDLPLCICCWVRTQEGWGLPPRGNCPQDHRIHYLEKNKQK